MNLPNDQMRSLAISGNLAPQTLINKSNTNMNVDENNTQNPFKITVTNENSSNTSRNNNPFGDSFSQLNDNEIFGLEFDRIRQSNEKNSSNNINAFNPTGKIRMKFYILFFYLNF
jgi:hypothetical protein